MDYQKIYQHLIDRGNNRTPLDDEYYERHHIIPRCLGGTDDPDNVVTLTGREHFIAHLCLVKIHKDNHKLVHAANMMSVGSMHNNRSGNRRYEWLRKLHSNAISVAQTGEGNSQFGSVWIFNETLKENKKVKRTDLDSFIMNGWQAGRVTNFNAVYQTCEVCNKKHRWRYARKTCSDECNTILVGKHKLFTGREAEFISLYAETKSMNKALKAMGFPGARSHYYHWAKTLV